MSVREKYRAVIGLEIHAQLASKSKIYCADAVEFAGQPNSRISPISLGHPGTLPTLNRACVDLAIKMGLATGCSIAEHCYFARKNYFYPDLPKGYQISQDKTPICTDGHLDVRLKDGSTHHVRIQRIHMEEDAGKSLHDQDPFDTLIDLNRASVGLIEIVSHPDMFSAEQAMAYLTEVRKIVRYLDICDGNMEEGSLRCDANVSVMLAELPIDMEHFGTRAEVKNMNSISNVGRAINHEIERQIALIEAGGKVARETRTWDAPTGKTSTMRDKESADDYRYFPEPDLQPMAITQAMQDKLLAQMPELPEVIFKRLTTEHKLPVHDATLITEDREVANYYLRFAEAAGGAYKAASNWMNGFIKTWMNEEARHINEFPISASSMAEVVKLVEGGTTSNDAAKSKLLPALLQQPDAAPDALVAQLGIKLENNTGALAAVIAGVIAANPSEVSTYLGGKAGLLGFFVGQVMKQSGAKADPKVVNQMVRDALEAQRT